MQKRCSNEARHCSESDLAVLVGKAMSTEQEEHFAQTVLEFGFIGQTLLTFVLYGPQTSAGVGCVSSF